MCHLLYVVAESQDLDPMGKQRMKLIFGMLAQDSDDAFSLLLLLMGFLYANILVVRTLTLGWWLMEMRLLMRLENDGRHGALSW